VAYDSATQITEGDSSVVVTDSGTGKVEVTVDNVEVADFTTGEIVFNETGANQDFRVEGDTNANLIVADAGVDKVGIGTNTFNTNGGVLQVSNGISFPATQSALSDANTLDDYEEGTWTPTINFGGFSGSSAGVTYASQAGRYTKIGRTVCLSGEIVLSSKGSASGMARITGWIFTNGAARAAITFGNVNGMSSTGFINSYVEANNTYSNTYGTNTSGVQSQIADTEFTNTTHIQFTVTLQV
jgi:hypothetical protein